MPAPIRAALTRYRVMAYLTGVLLAVMTVVGLPFKYVFDGQATWYAIGWVGHGWAYVIYVGVALDLAFRLRWSLVRSLLVVLAGTIPFMSFVAEHYVSRDVRRGYDDPTPVEGPAQSADRGRH